MNNTVFTNITLTSRDSNH